MADASVPPAGAKPPRRAPRGPGAAVLLILLYGLLFLAALFLLRAKSPLFHRRSAGATPAVKMDQGVGAPFRRRMASLDAKHET